MSSSEFGNSDIGDISRAVHQHSAAATAAAAAYRH